MKRREYQFVKFDNEEGGIDIQRRKVLLTSSLRKQMKNKPSMGGV